MVGLTSSEDALSPYCAAQDALIRCIIALTADEPPSAAHRVRLLTAQASVGIVLGKRGATVSQLRQETGASIKVLPAEPLPAGYGGSAGGDEDAELGSISSAGGVSSGLSGMSLGTSAATTATTGGASTSGGAEEVIQVEGTVQQCVAALRGVATLLRGWQIRRLMATMQQQQQSFGAMQLQHAALAGGIPMSPTTGSLGCGPMSPPSPGALSVGGQRGRGRGSMSGWVRALGAHRMARLQLCFALRLTPPWLSTATPRLQASCCRLPWSARCSRHSWRRRAAGQGPWRCRRRSAPTAATPTT